MEKNIIYKTWATNIFNVVPIKVGADPCVRPDFTVEAAGRTHGSAPTIPVINVTSFKEDNA